MANPNEVNAEGANREVIRWMGVRAGPLMMVLAGLAFTLMVTFVKTARQEMSVLEVVFWRGAIAVPLAFAWSAFYGFRTKNVPVMALRVGFGFFAMCCYFFAARGLLITDLSLLGKLQPILIAVLAPWLLGGSERPGWEIWVLLGLGLVGSAILLAPELEVGSVYGIAALGATFFSGLAHICIRKLTATDPPAVIVLYFQGFVTVAAAILLVAGPMGLGMEDLVGDGLVLPDVAMWGPLVGVGVFAFIGQYFLTSAYRADSAAVVATAGYTTPVWAVMVDVVAFGDFPGVNAWIGGGVVVLSGLWLILRR